MRTGLRHGHVCDLMSSSSSVIVVPVDAVCRDDATTSRRPSEMNGFSALGIRCVIFYSDTMMLLGLALMAGEWHFGSEWLRRLLHGGSITLLCKYEVCDRQTSTSVQCCCTPSQWYRQIRSWSVTSAAQLIITENDDDDDDDDARRLALAGRSRTCAVQARRECAAATAPVSATHGLAVPDWLCYASLGHRQ